MLSSRRLSGLISRTLPSTRPVASTKNLRYLPFRNTVRCSSDYPTESDESFTKGNVEKPMLDNYKYRILPSETEERDDERQFVDMRVEDFEQIYSDDPTSKTKSEISSVLSLYEYLKYNLVGRVPSVLNEDSMRRLIEQPNELDRRRLIHFFYVREMAKLSFQRRKRRIKEEKRALMLEKYHDDTNRVGLLNHNGDILYGLWHNSLFTRLPLMSLKKGNCMSRLRDAALFGQKIVFDFGYEEHMKDHVLANAIEQVIEAYGLNRFHYRDPFDFCFSNLSRNSKSWKILTKVAKNLDTDAMITIEEKCFSETFDRSRLVYLSPHAPDTMREFNQDDVYIIGVFNDKGRTQPLSYRKAKHLGIRSMSLPLDRYVAWQGPNKNLCVNHVLGILLELRANNNDWKEAFKKHIPVRRIKSADTIREEEARRTRRTQKFNSLSWRNQRYNNY